MADPQAPQIPQRQFDPAALAALAGPAPQPAPPTAMPTAGTPNLMGMVPQLEQEAARASQLGTQTFQQLLDPYTAALSRLQQLQGAQATSPAMSYAPHFQPVTGPMSLLKDVGRGVAAAGLNLTKPGQALQAGLYAGPREEYARRAQEITQLQQQLQEQTGGLQAAAGLVSKPYASMGTFARGAGAMATGQAALSRVGESLQAIQLQHQDKLAQIAAQRDIATQRTDTEKELRRMIDETQEQIARENNTTKEEVAQTQAGSAQTIRNAIIAANPSLMGWLKEAVGMPTVQAPGGAAPVNAPVAPRQPAKPAAPTKGKAAPKHLGDI